MDAYAMLRLVAENVYRNPLNMEMRAVATVASADSPNSKLFDQRERFICPHWFSSSGRSTF